MKTLITLQVNGKKHELDIDPDTPLLYVLRNQLKLNGPKYGCGLGQCGACMVLIDGNAGPSCILPVSGIADKEIVTLEGIPSNGRDLHPVQEAFISEQAAQCGYCVNGMVVSAVALLEHTPAPNREDINREMGRVLCRCGTHSRFIKAINSASSKSK